MTPQCREWLVENRYVAKGKTVINGGSNGGVLVLSSTLNPRLMVITLLLLLLLIGLLVSACVNRAPEGLLGAAIAEVGVHDLLKVTMFSPYILCTLTECPFSDSSRTSPSDAHGPLTTAIRMIPTTLTSFIPSHRCTMCLPTRFFLQHYFSQLIVRDCRPNMDQLCQLVNR